MNSAFVFTKPGTEAGETLASIVARKEKERVAGNGIFWWGVGTSLGPALRKAAMEAAGELPILFVVHTTPARPKQHDKSPARVFMWTKWEDWDGATHDVPAHAVVTSRGDDLKRGHYALVCKSDHPLTFDTRGPAIDLACCKTALGKSPGTSQVTALVWGDPDAPDHRQGAYRVLFRARLVAPWQAKLVGYR